MQIKGTVRVSMSTHVKHKYLPSSSLKPIINIHVVDQKMNDSQQGKLTNLRSYGSALVNVNQAEDAMPNSVCDTRKSRGVIKIHNERPGAKLSDFIQPAKRQQLRKPKLGRKEKREANSLSSIEWPDLIPESQEESYCPGSVLSGLDSSPNCGYSDSLKRNTNIKEVQERCNSAASREHKKGASKVKEFKNSGETSKQSPKKADPGNLIKNVPDVIEGKIEKNQEEIQCSTQNWQDQRTKSNKTEISKKIKENLKYSDKEKLNEESETKKLTAKSLQDTLQFSDGNVVSTKKSNEEQDIIREKRKRRRHIIRARKREQKEAELLQQLRAPKDSKITILSGNALNKFLKPSKLNTKPKVEFSALAEDFPDLNVVNTVSAPEALEKLKVAVMPIAEAETPLQTCIENRKDKGILEEIEQAEKNIGEKKAPKSSDPIQLNLFDIALAKSVVKQKMKERRSMLHTTKRKSDFDKIIANSLDSNAPILSRGKIRTRRKKPTLMKKVILKQRQERQKLLFVSTGMVAASPRNLSDEAIDGEWLDQPEAIENRGKIFVVKKKMKKKKKVKTLDSNNDEPICHTKKFREYCDQMLTDDIETVCVDLLHDLVRFQDRAHQKDPIKAKMKKRLVFGLRETTRQVERGRVKAVVIASNLEKCNEPGGLDEAVKSLLDQVHKKDVFCVYALDRWRLSRATKKKGMTSCLGILNYQGSNENYKKLQVLVEEARSEYERRSSKNKIVQNVSIEKANTDISKNYSRQQSSPEIAPVLLSLIKMELKD